MLMRPLLGRRWIGSRVRSRSVTELLADQLNTAIEAADVVGQVCLGEVDAQAARKTMRRIEHEGDRLRTQLMTRTSSALTVPLEREDLIRSSRAIDDVLDILRDMVRELALWEVPTGRWSQGMLAPVVDSLRALRRAVTVPDGQAGQFQAQQARIAARKVHLHYQQGSRRILVDPLTLDTVKQMEVLRRLLTIEARLMDAADAVLDGIVKRYL